MAEPTFIGRVFVHGIDGTLAYSGMATTANELTRATFEDNYTRHDSLDKKGETIGVQGWNPNPKVEVTFLVCQPAGAGAIALAKTNLDTALPAFGAKVTLASFAGAMFNSALWLYFGGGRIEQVNDQLVMMTLPLEKFRTDIAATANT